MKTLILIISLYPLFGYSQPLGKTMPFILHTNNSCQVISSDSDNIAFSCDGFYEQYFFNEKGECVLIMVDVLPGKAISLFDDVIQAGYKKVPSGGYAKCYSNESITYQFMPSSIDEKRKDRIGIFIYYNKDLAKHLAHNP